MNLTLLRGYNNYFDRIVRKENTLNDYFNKVVNYENRENINFVPNDNVNTEQIINHWTETWTPDYLIVSDEDDKIISRWFVLDAIRTRGSQYKLTLKRDVIVDNFNEILSSNIYIEKGILNKTDPLIYNTENMHFNEIKTSQDLLKDKSKCAWLVGYYDQKERTTDNSGKTTEVGVQTYNFSLPSSLIGNVVPYEDLSAYQKKVFDDISLKKSKRITIANINDSPFSISLGINAFNRNWAGVPSVTSCYVIRNTLNGNLNYTLGEDNTGALINTLDSLLSYPVIDIYNDYAKYYNLSNSRIVDIYDKLVHARIIQHIKNVSESNSFSTEMKILDKDFQKAIIKAFNDYNFYDKYILYENEDSYTFNNQNNLYNEILKLRGKIIKKDKKYYQIDISNFSTAGESDRLMTNTSPEGKEFYNYFKNKFPDSFNSSADTFGYIICHSRGSSVKLTELISERADFNISINKNNGSAEAPEYLYHKHCLDSPYDIFVMPYTDNLYISKDGATYTKVPNYNKEIALLFARSILSESNGKICYDIQLLPYSTLSDSLFDTGTDEDNLYLNLTAAIEDYDYSLVKQNDTISGYLIWSSESKKEFNIQKNLKYLQMAENAIDIKIQNECDFVRLCSPNYSGLFDFNVAKNNGVKEFNIDIKLKPYNPYIHINPDFKGLYGADYNDSRGLICGGDFSLGYTTEAWTQYELNNKNYQQMFDREIKNMDTNHTYDMSSNIISSILGAGTTGIGAQGAASIAGISGPVGLMTAGASLAAGAIDIGMAEGKYQEQKSFKTDMYNMSLENIKAQPSSIAKVSAFTPNNKIFPFLEYYTCTDTEKDTLKEKIKYNGMTVGRIDILGKYISSNSTNYLKGQLIRNEELNDDTHMRNAIYEELNKGVYI